MLYLALNNKGNNCIDIKKISEELRIPTPFLAKILQTLAKHKILLSSKGPHGGFYLAKKASEIYLMDIIKIFDGEDVCNICLIGIGECKENETNEYHCPIHDKFEPIKNELINLFTTQTIQSLIDDIINSGKKIKL
jgi:Rrf2 family protein